MCDDVYIIIHGRLGLEERRILVVDVPTLEIQRDLILVGGLKMMEAYLLDMMTLSQRASCMRSRIRISTAIIAISAIAIATSHSVKSRTE